MFQFQHIEYLWALTAIPLMIVLYAFVIRYKKKIIKKIGDLALVNQLIKGYSPGRFFIKFCLIVKVTSS